MAEVLLYTVNDKHSNESAWRQRELKCNNNNKKGESYDVFN